jgi:hypothetical protein
LFDIRLAEDTVNITLVYITRCWKQKDVSDKQTEVLRQEQDLGSLERPKKQTALLAALLLLV